MCDTTIPDDRAVTRHPLYSVFFGKRSEKNGLFSKKVRILPLWRPVHTQKIAKRSPPKKSSKPYIQKILAIDQRKKDFFQKKFRFCLSDVPAVCKNTKRSTVSGKTFHTVYSLFGGGKRSEKNGLFSKKS